jgi:hypothetical protein
MPGIASTPSVSSISLRVIQAASAIGSATPSIFIVSTVRTPCMMEMTWAGSKPRISDQLVHARFAESMLVISVPSMSNKNAAKCRPSWGTAAGAVFEIFIAQGHTDCLAAFKVRNIVEQAINALIVPI